jgi:hypothetical protein
MEQEVRKFAETIKARFLANNEALAKIAMETLSGSPMPDEQVRNVCREANRVIKMHFLTSSDPAIRKKEFDVIDPDSIVTSLKAPSNTKTASQEETVDLSAYKQPWNMEKTASSAVTLEKIAEQFQNFDFVHTALVKLASPDYYKSGDIVTAIRVAMDKIARKLDGLETDQHQHLRKLSECQKEACKIFREGCLRGAKDAMLKVAESTGIFGAILQHQPTWDANIVDVMDKSMVVEKQRNLEFYISKCQEHQDEIAKIIMIARDYGIVSDQLKRYMDDTARFKNTKELNELIMRLDGTFHPPADALPTATQDLH